MSGSILVWGSWDLPWGGGGREGPSHAQREVENGEESMEDGGGKMKGWEGEEWRCRRGRGRRKKGGEEWREGWVGSG